SSGEWYVSVDGALSFSRVPSRGLPGELWLDQPYWREVPSPIRATPGRAGDVWFVSTRGLYRARDGGQNFRRVETGDVLIQRMDFGAPMPGADYPTLYAIAERAGARGIYRSADEGRTWV